MTKFWQVPEYLLVELKENIPLPLDILYMIEDVLWWDSKYRAKKRWVDKKKYPHFKHSFVMIYHYPTIEDMEGWYQRHIEDRRQVWYKDISSVVGTKTYRVLSRGVYPINKK
jgi:hypothetical protein